MPKKNKGRRSEMGDISENILAGLIGGLIVLISSTSFDTIFPEFKNLLLKNLIYIGLAFFIFIIINLYLKPRK